MCACVRERERGMGSGGPRPSPPARPPAPQAGATRTARRRGVEVGEWGELILPGGRGGRRGGGEGGELGLPARPQGGGAPVGRGGADSERTWTGGQVLLDRLTVAINEADGSFYLS
jgi:hypothetical protein